MIIFLALVLIVLMILIGGERGAVSLMDMEKLYTPCSGNGRMCIVLL